MNNDIFREREGGGVLYNKKYHEGRRHVFEGLGIGKDLFCMGRFVSFLHRGCEGVVLCM